VTTLVVEGPEVPLHTLLPVNLMKVILPGAAPCGYVSTLVRDHAGNLLLIRLIQNHVFIELALALGCLRSQDVALERVTAFDLATTCLMEALRRSAMCLKLRHSVFLLQHRNRRFGHPRADVIELELCRP
jgi:hypothetical protein